MKTKLLTAAVTLCALALALALGEAVLRMAGRKPWFYYKKDTNEPTMHEPDSVLGWRNKPGEYLVPAYSKKGDDVHLTFLEDGRRATGTPAAGTPAAGTPAAGTPAAGTPAAGDGSRELVVVGGSFTQGWAISDHETYAWKLQEKYPSLEVLNYGTGGYGTYQSLLVLERELPRLGSPALVLYGFIRHHEERNIGAVDWLRELSRYSRRGHVFVPYVMWDEKRGLVRYPPERYPAWPFRESLASVAVSEYAYMKVKARGRAHEQFVTQQVILEMKKLAERFGAEFVTVLLKAEKRTKKSYERFFRRRSIRNVDCAFLLVQKMRVQGEGHPNGEMNSRWADCIAEEIGAEKLGDVAALLP